MAAAKVSGFFTSLKKEVLTIGTAKTVDAHFEAAKTNFDNFVFATQTLKTHVDAWHAATKASAQAAEHVGNDYKNVMQTLTTHPLSQLADDGKGVQHAAILVWEGCEKQLDATCLAHFRELAALFAQLKERMKAREAARLDFDYRTKQVKDAHDARDKLLAKGKAEPPKDADKRLSAEKKLEDATNHWNALNSGVLASLAHLHDHRHDLLGVLYTEFLAVQRAYLRGATQNVDALQVPDVPAAHGWNLAPSAGAAGPSSTLGDAKAPEFADVNLKAAGPGGPPPPSYSAVSTAAAPPASSSSSAVVHPPPPQPPAKAGGVGGLTAAQQQQRDTDRQNAAAAAIMASLPPGHSAANGGAATAAGNGGVNIHANFAADDEAAMRGGGGGGGNPF